VKIKIYSRVLSRRCLRLGKRYIFEPSTDLLMAFKDEISISLPMIGVSVFFFVPDIDHFFFAASPQ
jgi:hypothetical protein